MRDYAKLDTALDERRLQLGKSWGQLAKRVGISESGLRNVRRGKNEPNALTKARIDDAFEWAPGSTEAVLSGGEPVPTDARQQGRSPALQALYAALDEIQTAIKDLEDRQRRDVG